MDWLDKRHAILDWNNKTFTCLDEEGKHSIVKIIPRPISIREISTLLLKRCFEERTSIVSSPCGGTRKDQRAKY
jgi:hypothetical protein